MVYYRGKKQSPLLENKFIVTIIRTFPTINRNFPEISEDFTNIFLAFPINLETFLRLPRVSREIQSLPKIYRQEEIVTEPTGVHYLGRKRTKINPDQVTTNQRAPITL